MRYYGRGPGGGESEEDRMWMWKFLSVGRKEQNLMMMELVIKTEKELERKMRDE